MITLPAVVAFLSIPGGHCDVLDRITSVQVQPITATREGDAVLGKRIPVLSVGSPLGTVCESHTVR